MKKLIKGIIEFRQNVLQDYKETFAKLALTQKPDALFIACSDSRVVPNLFASTNPGDLFVIRNIGNLVPPYDADKIETSNQSIAAALEFALIKLNIRQIIVCGHSACGAMNALSSYEKLDATPAVKGWLQAAHLDPDSFNNRLSWDPSLNQTDTFSQMNVLLQIEHLKTYPIVNERLSKQTLSIHGWWFDIAHADVHAYEDEFKKFMLIDEPEAERILAKLDE